MASAPPRWKAIIEQAINKHRKSAVFQLATCEKGVPRVRSLIFRGFLPEASIIPLLLSTTDIRTPKVRELSGSPDIELCWWVEGTQEQFRIVGRAFIVPAPDRQLATHVGEYGKKSRALRTLEKAGLDWEVKRREMFNALSAHMRASWCLPVSGSSLASDEAKKWREKLPKLGEASDDDERKDLEVAFGNFALVVIEPAEVDYLELSVMPNRRTIFRLEGEDCNWVEKAVVP